MPFVTVSMPDEHFDALQSSSLQGHDVVKNVGTFAGPPSLRLLPLLGYEYADSKADMNREGPRNADPGLSRRLYS